MSIKILLADDSLTIQKVVELTFSDAETRLMAVGSGDKAVQALDEFQPDIVLADVVMPGLSGYDVCEAVKKRPGGAFVPVVLLTGTFEPFDRARADRVGGDAIVTKPFDSHALQGLVRELVAKGSAAREAAEAAPPPATEPLPPPAFTLSDLEAPPESAVPVDIGSTLVLTPLDLDAAAPPPFVEAATAAPAGESIYATMAMKVPTPEELAAAAPSPFELAEAPPAPDAPEPFQPEEPLPLPVAAVAETVAPALPFEMDEAPAAAPAAEPAAPAAEEVPWSEEPALEAAPPAEPVLSVEPPPPPPHDPLSAYVPPPPPPFEAAEAFVPPPPPPPPAFYEPEPPPPPPPFFEPEPAAVSELEVPGPDTAPVLPLVPAMAPEAEPFEAAPAAEEEIPAETAPEAPFEPELASEVAAGSPVGIEIEIEPEGEPAPAEVLAEPAAPDAVAGEESAAERPSEAVEPFPEMDAAAHVAEEAPWDEGPDTRVPPPPPNLEAGPEEFSDGTEPITRDLEADMQAFEESGRVRRRPEIWERHAALIGEEVPEDIDVPGVVPEAPVATSDESRSTDLEEIAAAARLEDLSALIPAGAASAPGESAVVPEPVAAVTTAPISPAPGAGLSDSDVDRIARRVVELLSDKVVRDIAWEVVPEYAERLVRERIAEVERAG
ncbi:MAG: response regulator [Thermoanaerobaculia bacterium]